MREDYGVGRRQPVTRIWIDVHPLLARIEADRERIERMTAHLIDIGEAQWCDQDCGTLILDGDDSHSVVFDDGECGTICAECFDQGPALLSTEATDE